MPHEQGGLDFSQFLNQNKKSVAPDGTVNFFDDTDLLTRLVGGGGFGATGTPNQSVGAAQVANTGGPVTGTPATPALEGQQEGGFDITSPSGRDFLLSIADLVDPQGAGRSGALRGRLQSELMLKLMEQLTQQAVAGGSSPLG